MLSQQQRNLPLRLLVPLANLPAVLKPLGDGSAHLGCVASGLKLDGVPIDRFPPAFLRGGRGGRICASRFFFYTLLSCSPLFVRIRADILRTFCGHTADGPLTGRIAEPALSRPGKPPRKFRDQQIRA